MARRKEKKMRPDKVLNSLEILFYVLGSGDLSPYQIFRILADEQDASGNNITPDFMESLRILKKEGLLIY